MSAPALKTLEGIVTSMVVLESKPSPSRMTRVLNAVRPPLGTWRQTEPHRCKAPSGEGGTYHADKHVDPDEPGQRVFERMPDLVVLPRARAGARRAHHVLCDTARGEALLVIVEELGGMRLVGHEQDPAEANDERQRAAEGQLHSA